MVFCCGGGGGGDVVLEGRRGGGVGMTFWEGEGNALGGWVWKNWFVICILGLRPTEIDLFIAKAQIFINCFINPPCVSSYLGLNSPKSYTTVTKPAVLLVCGVLNPRCMLFQHTLVL